MHDKNPRQIAARVLSQRLTSSEYTENLLETALATARLSPPDRGLCHELVCGVVRWQATLDCLIARKTTPGRDQRPALQNLLRLGLYQIFWLDRIPPHAAVNEMVELAKRSGYASQAGFVNAILRGYLRETDAIRKILADMKISQPALGWSHPEWLVNKWRKNFGEDATRALLAWNNTPPVTYARVNTLKATAAALMDKWREEGVDSTPVTGDATFIQDKLTGDPVAFKFISHPPLSTLMSFKDGWFYIQDPSTLLAPNLLGAQPGETILDACAAPGGKTTYLAQLMSNQGRILARDISLDRLSLVRDNAKRLGATCVELPSAILNPQSSILDRVLIDAPCSNTGVLRRRVDLRWRIQPLELDRLRQTQLQLLDQHAGLLKAGGVMIYSTCSLEPEENTGVVQQFLAAHPDWKLVAERQLLPWVDGVDGAYVAKLEKLT